MPKRTTERIADKIKTLTAAKERKIELVSKTNDEIKQLDAEIKELNEVKAKLDKAEQAANDILNINK